LRGGVSVVGMRLATYNVENLFARAKALNADSFADGEPALAAYGEFNRIAAKPKYLAEDTVASDSTCWRLLGGGLHPPRVERVEHDVRIAASRRPTSLPRSHAATRRCGPRPTRIGR
jgi:hypothetical protein